jgi:hypothetical protein
MGQQFVLAVTAPQVMYSDSGQSGARMVVAGGDHGALVNGLRDSFCDFSSISIQ